MSIPTARDLATMRADVLLLMPDRADITDPGSVVITDSGGTDVTGPSTTSNVPCRLARSNLQAIRTLFGDQAATESSYMLTLPYGTTIKPGWEVVVNGVTYRVRNVAQSDTWGAAVRAQLMSTETVGG